MRELAAAQLTAHLNTWGSAPVTAEEVARTAAAVRGDDVAHHVVDPDGLSGLDAWRAVELGEALPR
ncbi:MAG: hypothetical protein ACLGIF_05360, partial [Actinomycetes bacterium]